MNYRNSQELVHQNLDLLIANVNNHGVGRLKSEIESRKQRSSKILGDKDFFMEHFAEKIAFSQNAKADKVRKMNDAGVLREAFHNFEVNVVATLHSGEILESYWEKLKVIRFPGKIASIIGCATALESIEKNGESMKSLLKNVPRNIENLNDLETFWDSFCILKNRLDYYGVPFFSNTISLLHLLSDLGFYCLKPDLVVMKIASKGLGIVPSRKSKQFPDRELVKVVRAIQEYSFDREMRPEVVDLYLLIEGGQTWTKWESFVTQEFQPKFGPYS